MSLVERAAEVERVRAVLAAARDGDGGALVLVSGEAGAGKSALLREALAGIPTYWGYCEPGPTPRPFGPFRDVLLAGALDGTGTSGDPAEPLRAAMLDSPLVVVLEDAHWIDDASLRALRYLGRRIAGTRGVVLVSYRDNLRTDHPLREVLGDLTGVPGLHRVELAPLTEAGVAELLAGSGRDAAETHRVTGGNPLMVAALRDAPDEEVSATVRDMAWSRARRLAPAELALLKDLVVVPGRIPVEDLRDRATDLDALVVSGLLQVEGTRLRFRHELVRRALAHDLTPDERIRAHAAAYRRLRDGPDAEPSELAFHALHAGMSAEALPLELRAAELAMASGAHTQAAEHFRRAVDLGEGRLSDAELARVCAVLSNEEYTIGRDTDARRYAAKAVALTRHLGDRALYGAALVARSRCAASEADCVGFAEEAAEVLEELGPGPELAAACAQAASRRMVARDLDAAGVWARRALAMVEEAEHPAIATVALQSLGSALTLSGRDDACTHLRRAVEVSRSAGLDEELGLTWTNFVSAAGEARLYDVVAGIEGEAVAFFADRDLDGLAGYTYAWLGRCAFEQGRWDEALDWVERRLDTGDRASDISVMVALYVRARVLLRRGDDGATAPLAEARERALRVGALQRIGPVAAARAEEAWFAGTPGDLAELEAALELAQSRSSPGLVGELTFWRQRHGVPAPDAAALAHPWNLWAAGDHAAAGDAWMALGCPYEAADAWSGSGEEHLVRQALEIVDRLGAAPLRARAVRRLRELGVRSIPRGPRRETAEDAWGLTAREQEVLVWLGEGSTDAEIAAGLHLSVKTVGHHVSAILRKTGSASRRDLRGTLGSAR